MLYIIKDFLLSRNGKIATVCITAMLSIVYVTKTRDKKPEPLPASTVNSSVWDDENSHSDNLIQHKERNGSFKPFTPVAPIPEKPAPVTPPTPEAIIPPSPPMEPVKAFAPLIKEERQPATAIAKTEPWPVQLPALESGAIIHCRLLTPATTDQANAPVIAQITRPVIRDGITLMPRGSRLSGKIKTSKNNRVFFAPDWQVSIRSNKQLSLSGYVQEKSYNSQTRSYNIADGRLGLPGFIENEPKVKKTNILGSVLKGIARTGKETVKTTAGEYIPASARNAAIDIGSNVVDGIIPKQKKPTIKKEPYILVPAGMEFYLVIASTGQPQGSQQFQETSIDQLWAEAMRKRLSRPNQ